MPPSSKPATDCLHGDTVLIHATSAWPVTVRDLVNRREGIVLTMREAGVIVGQRPSAYIAHEPAQLYRLTTQTGRTIEATGNHPLLTRDGWKPLLELEPTDRVAGVAEYPDLFGRGDADLDLVKLLAYLTSNAAREDRRLPFMQDPEVRRDFDAALDAKGDTYVELIEDGVTRGRVCGRLEAHSKTLSFLNLVNVPGVPEADRVWPDLIFGLRKEKLRLFLNRAFTCDGTPEASGRICYRSPSRPLTRQLQHLLARFGIVSILGDQNRPAPATCAELWIESKTDVVRYIDEIGFLGEKATQAEFLRASLYDLRARDTERDRLGPILFDRVVSIEATRVAPVFDLRIEGSHNFIANDFVVHNSSWCACACQVPRLGPPIQSSFAF